nr:CHASE domain-containing protein [Roseibium litorale]
MHERVSLVVSLRLRGPDGVFLLSFQNYFKQFSLSILEAIRLRKVGMENYRKFSSKETMFGVFFVAALCFVSGGIEWYIVSANTVEPMVWLPAGVAMAALVIWGPRLWPGPFLGTLALHLLFGSVQNGWGNVGVPFWGRIEGLYFLSAGLAAAGALLQPLAGWFLIRRFLFQSAHGPLALTSPAQVCMILIFGSVACVISPAMDTFVLSLNGEISPENWGATWFGLWIRNSLGFFVLLPLAAFAQIGGPRLFWRGRSLQMLPLSVLLGTLAPLTVSVFAWAASQTAIERQGQSLFETYVEENRLALTYRLQSYVNALNSTKAFITTSSMLSQSSLAAYVETLDIERTLPGINGIGWIEDVPEDEIGDFVREQRENGQPDFDIRAPKPGGPYYVITYIEPRRLNQQAVGLNIAFEANRRSAAEQAWQTGDATITKKITLVQDDQQTPGFLLLQPVYDAAAVTGERKTARGWIYAPFIASRLLDKLTGSQEDIFNLKIYGGTEENEAELIYTSSAGHEQTAPRYIHKSVVEQLGQKWLIVWRSTQKYDQLNQSPLPVFILIVGVTLSCLSGAFIVIFRSRLFLNWGTDRSWRGYVLPSLCFITCLGAVLMLNATMREQELERIYVRADKEAEKYQLLLTTRVQSYVTALKRMARRWEMANGTPFPVWQDDAANYVLDMISVEALEYIDKSLHIRWVEPVAGNETVIGLMVAPEEARKDELLAAAKADRPFLTPPFALKQGYEGFVTYVPITINRQFEGFIAAVFSVDKLFGSVISPELGSQYHVSVEFKGSPKFQSGQVPEQAGRRVVSERTINLYGQSWTLRISPKGSLASEGIHDTSNIALLGGLSVSLVLAILTRVLLVSRQRASTLQGSLRTIERQTSHTNAILSTVLDGVLTVDRQGHILSINPAGAQIFGGEPGDFVGKPYLSLIAFSQASSALVSPEGMARFLSGAVGQVREQKGVRRDGEVFPMETLIGEMGNVSETTYVVSVRDVSDRMAAIEALRASDSLNSAVLRSAQYMVVATQLDGTVTVFNEAAEKLLGEKAEDVIGQKKLMDWIANPAPSVAGPEADLARALFSNNSRGKVDMSVFLDLLEGQHFQESEWTFRRATGETFPVSIAMSSLMDEQQIIHGYVGIIEDISSKRKQQDALQSSEETFRSAMQFASIGMALVAPDGRWLKVNSALCGLLGYDEEELLSMDFQSISHPSDLEEDLKLTEETFSGLRDSFQLEKRFIHRDGHAIWVHLSTALVRDTAGEPKYFVSQILDISERREMDRIKSEFISIVSHELRTPLTAIRGSLGLLIGSMQDKIPETGMRMLTIAQQNSERLTLLINDILDIDKIASGNMHYDIQSEGLAQLLTESLEANQPYADRFDITLELKDIDEDLEIPVDRQRFLQIMANLLSNAVKFSPPGGKVEVLAETGETSVLVSVRDYGQGISPEFHSRIFGKFNQQDSSGTRAKGGTGLGLHITKQLVEQMHGKISFTSEVEAGTTFVVEFPKTEDFSQTTNPQASEQAGAELPRQKILSQPSAQGLPLILHLEQDASFSQFLADSLSGYANLINAGSISEARHLLENQKFDLIVAELDLKDGDYLDFHKMADASGQPHIPTVLLSAQEASGPVTEKVSAAFVKSKTLEEVIVDQIRKMLETLRPGEDETFKDPNMKHRQGHAL